MITDIFDAWLYHWGWLWMLVGLSGWVFIMIVSEN